MPTEISAELSTDAMVQLSILADERGIEPRELAAILIEEQMPKADWDDPSTSVRLLSDGTTDPPVNEDPDVIQIPVLYKEGDDG